MFELFVKRDKKQPSCNYSSYNKCEEESLQLCAVIKELIAYFKKQKESNVYIDKRTKVH